MRMIVILWIKIWNSDDKVNKSIVWICSESSWYDMCVLNEIRNYGSKCSIVMPVDDLMLMCRNDNNVEVALKEVELKFGKVS